MFGLAAIPFSFVSTGSIQPLVPTYYAVNLSLLPTSSMIVGSGNDYNINFDGPHVDVIPPAPPGIFNLDPTRYRRVYPGYYDKPLIGGGGSQDPLTLEWYPKRWLLYYL